MMPRASISFVRLLLGNGAFELVFLLRSVRATPRKDKCGPACISLSNLSLFWHSVLTLAREHFSLSRKKGVNVVKFSSAPLINIIGWLALVATRKRHNSSRPHHRRLKLNGPAIGLLTVTTHTYSSLECATPPCSDLRLKTCLAKCYTGMTTVQLIPLLPHPGVHSKQ